MREHVYGTPSIQQSQVLRCRHYNWTYSLWNKQINLLILWYKWSLVYNCTSDLAVGEFLATSAIQYGCHGVDQCSPKYSSVFHGSSFRHLSLLSRLIMQSSDGKHYVPKFLPVQPLVTRAGFGLLGTEVRSTWCALKSGCLFHKKVLYWPTKVDGTIPKVNGWRNIIYLLKSHYYYS